MTATALSATMMTSSFVLLHSSYTAWQAHEADLDRSTNATAVLRHLVQHIRQSAGVSAISLASDSSGALTIVLADGTTLAWDHTGSGVTLSVDGGAAHPLADDIQALTFIGYEADGATATTTPEDIHVVRTVVTTQQPAGGTRTISSYAWVRSW